MQTLHFCNFRTALLLGIAIALMATLACGSAAEPDTAASGSTDPASTTSGDHGHNSDPGQVMQDQTSSEEVHINLPISGRSTTATRDDLRVSQGDTVRLTFEADEEGEIHLHGYDLTADVSPGHPGELVFEAATAGAFALNFHVFADAKFVGADDHHGSETPETVVSETPVSVQITAESDGKAGVNVSIVTEGFRFAPELVDQPHTPGAGHAHIYANGVKLGRVFASEYHIAELPPGDHEIRVSLNANDHGDLVYGGAKVESIVTVTVPDVGQADGDSDGHQHDDGHGHSHGTAGQREIVAEVHLGNMEIYP